MKTIALALAATTLASAPASAGVYVNTELNQGHVGYEGGTDKVAFYVQGGPTVLAANGVDGTETELSGKIGTNIKATDKLAFYGEFAGISDGDLDNVYNVKAGAKYSF